MTVAWALSGLAIIAALGVLAMLVLLLRTLRVEARSQNAVSWGDLRTRLESLSERYSSGELTFEQYATRFQFLCAAHSLTAA
jgi:hypothetical protein